MEVLEMKTKFTEMNSLQRVHQTDLTSEKRISELEVVNRNTQTKTQRKKE